MRYTIIFLAISLNSQLYAQDTTTSLLSKETQMFNAICNGDRTTAEKLFASDYITINADGKMKSRNETMQEFDKFKGSTFRLSERMVRRYGQSAIITGKADFYVKSILVAAVYYTEIWVLTENEWKFTGWQGTMTGLPSWYSVIVTAIGLIILFALWSRIKKRRALRAKM